MGSALFAFSSRSAVLQSNYRSINKSNTSNSSLNQKCLALLGGGKYLFHLLLFGKNIWVKSIEGIVK